MAGPRMCTVRNVVAIAMCWTVASCSRPAPQPALPPGATIVALGDSLTYGTGATRDASYPTQLARRSGWNVVNAGVPGDTAAQGCARLQDLIDEHEPQLVLVLLGGNDFLRRASESAVAQGLKPCVDAARASQVAMALIPVPRLGGNGLSYPPLYDEVARAASMPLLDAGLDDLLATRSMRADAVHLNAAGYEAFAKRLTERLAAHGWLAR